MPRSRLLPRPCRGSRRAAKRVLRPSALNAELSEPVSGRVLPLPRLSGSEGWLRSSQRLAPREGLGCGRGWALLSYVAPQVTESGPRNLRGGAEGGSGRRAGETGYAPRVAAAELKNVPTSRRRVIYPATLESLTSSPSLREATKCRQTPAH